MTGTHAEKELYEGALEIAIIAHYDQRDKLGEPYIDHPIRVSMSLDTYISKSLGLLHDVDEDDSLYNYDMSDYPDIYLEILDLLRHHKRMPYKEYIMKLSTSALATKVKIADLMDNTDSKRLDALYKIDPKTALRVAKKYVWALKFLTQGK